MDQLHGVQQSQKGSFEQAMAEEDDEHQLGSQVVETTAASLQTPCGNHIAERETITAIGYRARWQTCIRRMGTDPRCSRYASGT